MAEEREKRRKSIAAILHTQLSRVVKKDPKVRKMLTSKEIEGGLQTLINRIVEEILKKEEQLGRRLTLEEFRERIMEVLNEFAPETRYIV